MLPTQLQRIARRCALGMGRTGTAGYDSSGDLFVAFTTARSRPGDVASPHKAAAFLSAREMDQFFSATVDSTEEAIINALVGARSMVGHRGRSLEAIDHEWLSSFCAS
jgi:L-aminopeptidase/D-esterase-like protein